MTLPTTRPGRRAILAILAAGLLGPAAGRADPPVLSDTPPIAFEIELGRATGPAGDRRDTALTRLAREADWEPYFRAAFNACADPAARARLRPALDGCRAALLAWNLTRAKGWAADLRLDYLTTLAAATDDAAAAAAIGQYVVTAQEAIHGRFRAVGHWPGNTAPPKNGSFLLRQEFAQLAQGKGFTRLSGDRVSVWDPARPVLIHARSGEIKPNAAHTWICLADTQLVELTPIDHVSWQYSVVCLNGDATFPHLHESLVVCDGNVKLATGAPRGGGCKTCVVIANGDVTTSDNFELDNGSVVYAAGDFTGSKDGWKRQCSVVTGGTNEAIPDFSDPEVKKYEEHYKKYFRSGVKENPFGVKFVSPADAGVELDVTDRGVWLGRLQPTSSVAKAGLEKGDRIVSLNGVEMRTAADFRRQLRESLVWGTGLFEVRRATTKFLRLVRFAEPPKKP